MKLFVFIIVIIFLTSCATSRKFYYKIERGDTIDKIANRFNRSSQEIVETNKIIKPDMLRPGTIILIPSLQQKDTELGLLDILLQKDEKVANFDFSKDVSGKFAFPTQKLVISSPFGKRGKKMHTGIDIAADGGSPVFAAESGVVIYSNDEIKGYGNLVIIKHSNDISTVYAHNKKNLVKKNDIVSKGQKIALVGKTGKAHGTHLHFEVRKDKEPVNPMGFLKR